LKKGKGERDSWEMPNVQSSLTTNNYVET